MTYSDNYDQMKELEEKQPELLDNVLSSHFTTNFMIDIIQFCFAFLVEPVPVNTE